MSSEPNQGGGWVRPFDFIIFGVHNRNRGWSGPVLGGVQGGMTNNSARDVDKS